jgi:serine/threonine protein kinase
VLEDDNAIARQRVGLVLDGKWKLEQLLGVGGMAAVYRAAAPDGRVAAVKLLHPEMSLKRDVRERFLREAYAANRVAHPGAVAVLEHGGGGEQPAYLVMELLEGDTLSARFRRQGGLGLQELLDVLEQVLDVLVCAHERGIVHRDLKPDNLFITADGRVKVLDFGLARIIEGAPGDYRTQTGMALGTLPYMAPEQALGLSRDIDGRADLFSMGATAFRILAGRRVHEAESEAELLMAMASKPAPRLSTVAPAIPIDVCAVVDLALAFARDARYPDARTMLGDVRALRAAQRPPYVTRSPAVLGRDEPTRVERAAPAAVREPTRVDRPVVGRGLTLPMPVVENRVPSEPPPSEAAPAGGAAAISPPRLASPEPPPPTQAAPATPSPVGRRALGAIAAGGLLAVAFVFGILWAGRSLLRSPVPAPMPLASGSASTAAAPNAPTVDPETLYQSAPTGTVGARKTRPGSSPGSASFDSGVAAPPEIPTVSAPSPTQPVAAPVTGQPPNAPATEPDTSQPPAPAPNPAPAQGLPPAPPPTKKPGKGHTKHGR